MALARTLKNVSRLFFFFFFGHQREEVSGRSLARALLLLRYSGLVGTTLLGFRGWRSCIV